jgi:hypothetical protein
VKNFVGYLRVLYELLRISRRLLCFYSTPKARKDLPEMEALRYRPLNTSIKEIRLLSIIHNGDKNAAQCSIEHHPLLSSPPYVALSYAWREPSTGEGEVPSQGTTLVDGQDFLVTANLALALRTLRLEEVCIWIDALCIDQGNNAERGTQVSIMHMIYERAKKVIVWLGPERDDSTLAIDFLELVAKQSAKGDFLAWLMKAVEESLYHREWIAVQKLFERAWWTRTWAVQEFVLGKEVDFVCGQKILVSERLEQVLGQIHHYGLSLSKILHDRHL